MRILPLIGWLLLGFCSPLPGEAPPPPATADGFTTPIRIISCAPNLTQMIFALGAGEQVVGVTRYCEDPPEAASRTAMGDLFHPNLEAMVAARPDMIVLYPSSAKVHDFFAGRPEVRLVVTNTCETLEEIDATLRHLGDALGRRERAEELIAATSAEMRALGREHAGATPPPKVLIVVGRQRGSLANLYAAGHGTYLDELLGAAGAENVVPADLGRYPVLARETLIGLRPDLIIETHHEVDTESERAEASAAWGRLTPVPAVRNGRIAFLIDKRVLLPGAFAERDAGALRQLIRENLAIP